MKYILIVLLRRIIKIFNIFPVRNNRIIFNSYNGKQYSCNPKYIYEKIKDEGNTSLDLIWTFNNPEDFNLGDETTKVKYKSLTYIYYVMTSKIVIENSESWSIIPKRKGQIVINTWHGGGSYKKVGKSRDDGRWFNSHNVQYKNDRIDMYISSSQVFTQETLRDSFGFQGQVLDIGMPRNDFLFEKNIEKSNEIKTKLGIGDQNVVLVAPTFRKKTDFDLKMFEFDLMVESLKKRFDGEWIVLFRSHYYDNKEIGIDNVRDVSSYGDMQELLYISDVLITDFSSSMWDFSLMYKPIFLLASDLDKYIETERDFYTHPRDWPFPFAETFEEFLKNIENFDEHDYLKKIRLYHKELGSFEKGNATNDIKDLIFDILSEGEQYESV